MPRQRSAASRSPAAQPSVRSCSSAKPVVRQRDPGRLQQLPAPPRAKSADRAPAARSARPPAESMQPELRVVARREDQPSRAAAASEAARASAAPRPSLSSCRSSIISSTGSSSDRELRQQALAPPPRHRSWRSAYPLHKPRLPTAPPTRQPPTTRNAAHPAHHAPPTPTPPVPQPTAPSTNAATPSSRSPPERKTAPRPPGPAARQATGTASCAAPGHVDCDRGHSPSQHPKRGLVPLELCAEPVTHPALPRCWGRWRLRDPPRWSAERQPARRVRQTSTWSAVAPKPCPWASCPISPHCTACSPRS